MPLRPDQEFFAEILTDIHVGTEDYAVQVVRGRWGSRDAQSTHALCVVRATGHGELASGADWAQCIMPHLFVVRIRVEAVQPGEGVIAKLRVDNGRV